MNERTNQEELSSFLLLFFLHTSKQSGFFMNSEEMIHAEPRQNTFSDTAIFSNNLQLL